MRLTPNFTLAEFERSGLAARRGIDNRLPKSLTVDAVETAEMMEAIRSHLSDLAGKPIPIQVTSGYRCLELNRLLGSKDTSDHVRMESVDFVAPSFGTPYQVCTALAPVLDELGIGQVIHEFGEWIHVSRSKPTRQANRVITISKAGVQLGIQEVA